jgi:hypothetical protein
MIFWISLIVCIAGLVIYAVSQNGKAQALALEAFWVGLLAALLLWSAASHPMLTK